ncbi:hypothetical protein [Actinacidiphila sp. ITFR-21]|uniref:hypothetical protein n=1 Tax=Actinacidiphila sp. ITFR-21 TaxID=3075199 RepID=UPI00288AA550|nr:hypothetical protein [Streptomyces sp. ITFR-21]WNI19907.1 hypothetical protein RLT57_12095 [Streptomyces sp. ITFR-21]
MYAASAEPPGAAAAAAGAPHSRPRFSLPDVTRYTDFPGQPMVIDTSFGIDEGREIHAENVF